MKKVIIVKIIIYTISINIIYYLHQDVNEENPI